MAVVKRLTLLALCSVSVALGGCIARTAIDLVSAPVRVASGAVDLATTSQSEADERRGRELREREERLGRLERHRQELDAQCEDGSRSACAERDAIGREIELHMPTIPAEPER